MFKCSWMDNNSPPCLITVPSCTSGHIIPVILSCYEDVHKQCSPAICLSFSNSSAFSLTYLCIESPGLCLAQLCMSILRDLLCQKHTLVPSSHKANDLPLGNSNATDFYQAPSLHLSLNSPAFLLICPATAQSRNTCLNMQWELYSRKHASPLL